MSQARVDLLRDVGIVVLPNTPLKGEVSVFGLTKATALHPSVSRALALELLEATEKSEGKG